MAGTELFGIHEQALQVQRRRMELIASNIANADTPNFQARDVDFRAVLAQAQAQAAPEQPARSHALHLSAGGLAPGEMPTAFRVPLQPAVDGNTVDVQVEQAQFAEAALRYQASLSFIDGRVRSLITALTGE